MRIVLLFTLCLLLNSCYYSRYLEATNHTEQTLELRSHYCPPIPELSTEELLNSRVNVLYKLATYEASAQIKPKNSGHLEFVAIYPNSITVKSKDSEWDFKLFRDNEIQVARSHPYKQSNSRRFLPISKAGRVKTYYFDIREDKDKGIYLQSGRAKLWPESRQKIVK